MAPGSHATEGGDSYPCLEAVSSSLACGSSMSYNPNSLLNVLPRCTCEWYLSPGGKTREPFIPRDQRHEALWVGGGFAPNSLVESAPCAMRCWCQRHPGHPAPRGERPSRVRTIPKRAFLLTFLHRLTVFQDGAIPSRNSVWQLVTSVHLVL